MATISSYKVKSIIQLFLITFVILFLFNISNKPSLTNIKYVNIGGGRVEVDLAITERARMIGLSGRASLDEDRGLLFIFDKLGRYSFWMKDMNFPIDIIWLAPPEGGDNDEMKIVFIKENALPIDYPETYTPYKDALYILEVVAGYTFKNNLKVGDTVEFGY